MDSEEEERDQKFAPPPAYFKQFATSKDALAVPDLECLLKKDYFIFYQQQKKVPLKSTLVMERPQTTQLSNSKEKRGGADGRRDVNGEDGNEGGAGGGNKLEDNEMFMDDDGDHLMGIQNDDDD